MHVPILTYHANNINGLDYHNNDHVALAADLKLIEQLEMRVISLAELMAWRFGQAPESTVDRAVVLTCDDGTDFDFHDIEHPTYGIQTSFFNLLKEHQLKSGQAVHMTNFVIVSPAARAALDARVLVGRNWWRDDWWLQAQQSGLMHIANHSWDHNHGIFDNQNTTDDSFHHIDNQAQCDQQLKVAQQHLIAHFKGDYSNPYFAYPYGNYSDYLRYSYLPKQGRQIGLTAAFTTEPSYVTIHSDLWTMPRFVCNSDWQSSAGLTNILQQA